MSGKWQGHTAAESHNHATPRRFTLESGAGATRLLP